MESEKEHLEEVNISSSVEEAAATAGPSGILKDHENDAKKRRIELDDEGNEIAAGLKNDGGKKSDESACAGYYVDDEMTIDEMIEKGLKDIDECFGIEEDEPIEENEAKISNAKKEIEEVFKNKSLDE